MWLSGYKLPITTIIVVLLCTCIVLFSLFANLRDKERLLSEHLEFDRNAVGVVERKFKDGNDYYVRYSFEYTDFFNNQRKEEQTVQAGQETYESLVLEGKVNIVYNSEKASISNIANNKYIDVIQGRVTRDLVLLCVFASGIIFSFLYIILLKKNIVR